MKKLFIFLIIVLQTVASIAQTAAELSKKALEFYVNKKYTKAVEYWNMAREKGDGDAYAFLAMCYEKGQGVKTDKEKQKSLLEQGAEMGNNMCLNDLGSYYFNGEGGMTNKGKAFDYYNRAAINGNETAQKNLGLCYEEGVGTEVNLRMAAMWYRVADISGDHAALNRYTQLSYKGYKLSKEEAVRFIENGYKLPDNPQMSDNTPVKGVSPSPIKINQGSCDNAGLAKTSYFHFHILLGQFWGSGKFYISFNGGEEIAINNNDTRIEMNPQKNMDIALVYRKANGKTYPLCTVKNSVEPGSTLYYKYSGTGTFRPMTENEIRKIQYNSVDKKSLLKTSQPRILADNAPAAATDGNIQPSGKVEKAPKSDVDISIPTSSVSADNTFAVIIANENYSCVSKVDFALNDGSTFSQYCNKTLGLPQKHIIMCKDATYGAMEAALARISHIGTAYSGDLNIIFYYAGHGIPDEKTRDSFLIPVDGDGSLLSTCFRTSSVYKRLADINAKSVVVFMDACFSGSVRGEGMLASARGVRIAAKDDQVGGNMVVFTAAHGDETAYPYAEQEHGLFTYYLLKKIQSTSGKATLGDLMDYVTSSVMRESVVSCGRTQTPTVISSTSSADWRNWNLCNF